MIIAKTAKKEVKLSGGHVAHFFVRWMDKRMVYTLSTVHTPRSRWWVGKGCPPSTTYTYGNLMMSRSLCGLYQIYQRSGQGDQLITLYNCAHAMKFEVRTDCSHTRTDIDNVSMKRERRMGHRSTSPRQNCGEQARKLY